jgi:hypothetical protein
VLAPIIPWPDLDSLIEQEINEFRKINSGIHIALLGTTRGGKTTLATGNGKPNQGILRNFEDVLILDTTGDPGAIHNYGKPLNKFGAIHGHRRLTVGDMSTKSKEKVYGAISKAVRQGNIAIYADELRQLTDKKFFGLGPALDHVWLFTAKKGVSLVGGTQAPRWLPGAFYDQSKLHFIFGIRDKRSRMRLGEISGDTDTLQAVIPSLKRWEFAFIGLDGSVLVSKFKIPSNKPPPEKKLVIQRGLTS